MVWLWIVVGLIVAAWVYANVKSSRPDGEVVGKVPKYRKMMFYLMPRRNDSLVIYDSYVYAEKLLEYLETATARRKTA